jgi:alpha-tubulin suppressor-like RCC1 family protein
MCLRVSTGDVACPLLNVGPLPDHSREVSLWFQGGLGIGSIERIGVCAILVDGTATCALATLLDPALYAPVGTGTRNISAGQDHYCAITDGGSLTCQPWQATSVAGSVNDPGLSSWSSAGTTLSNLVEAATASDYSGSTLVRTVEGDLWSLDEQNPDVVVNQVQGIGGPASQIVAGPTLFCALRTDGAVFCWNGSQFGLVTHAEGGQPPEQITSLPRPATAIAAAPGQGGGEFACALLDDTTVWCWGAGFGGFAGQRVAACD